MTGPTLDELLAMDKDQAIDAIFEAVDDALHAGHEARSWPEVERMLDDWPPERLPITLVVAVLSITIPVQTQPWRVAWAKRAEDTIRERAPDRAHGLLAGLVPHVNW